MLERDPAPEGDPPPGRADLGPGGRVALTVAWCSFLTACVSTMAFFAFVDPSPVAPLLLPGGRAPSRIALYSMGFFLFWTACAASAGLSAWMLLPRRRESP
jgi:hypothetical protein